MKAEELIAWASRAQNLREKSWVDPTPKNPFSGYYKLTMNEATIAAQPDGIPSHQFDTFVAIVTCLNYQCWNEVQDWQRELTTQQ